MFASGPSGRCFEKMSESRLYTLGSIAIGGLAQLARAPALQAGGQRFESVILHTEREHIDMLEAGYGLFKGSYHKGKITSKSKKNKNRTQSVSRVKF